ncbi:YcxB family protein [Paenibacillus larvae]|uniref:YcxB-like C-terminal domain-containing protein n=1 Tax=Paenibacillus larvae subsp. larvae TaxID=147375 RepID=A0A6C0QYQ0_9BACL|nr:YcxB family protein [Paenibacillus larvae]QHZ53651.1 hypothetical protein ERICV_04613 [Paenibacillus larvae subsp. larvae]
MKIQCETTADDFITFNMYHMKHAKSVQRSLLIQRFIIPFIYIMIPFILSYMNQEWATPFFVIFIGLAIVWAVFYPKFFESMARRSVTKYVSGANVQHLFGKQTLEVTEDGITEQNNGGETQVKWETVGDLVETDQHLFIYFNGLQAFIIPKQSFPDEESKRQFIETFRKWKQNPAPVSRTAAIPPSS